MNETRRKISFHDYFRDGTILVVDDMTNMRRTIKNILRNLGIEGEQILEANDGDTALKMLQEEKQNIIFVLLDWNMPRFAGIKVLQEMNEDEKLRKIPVLMVTAETYEEQIVQAVEYEVKNYIIKPFLADTLREKMMNVLNPPEYLQSIKDGEELIDKGENEKALTILEDVLKTKPNSASIRILIGRAYENMDNNETAQKFYEDAIQKNPHFLKAYDTLAEFLIKSGEKKEALHFLEEAAKLSPLNANRHIKIGDIVLETEGNCEKVKEAFKKAMRQSPETAKDVAEVYLKNEKPEEAENFFRIALNQKTNVYLYDRLGIALRHQKKYQDAVVEYQKALKVEPRNETLYYNMGMAYVEANKKDQAIEWFKKALEINPGFAKAKRMLQKLQTSTGSRKVRGATESSAEVKSLEGSKV